MQKGMKAIIALWGPKNYGKTSTIIETFNLLSPANPKQLGVDFCDVIDTKLGKIGFSSYGDPEATDRKTNIQNLINKDCSIILTACRTKGDTVHDLENFAPEYGYELIWISPAQSLTVSTDLLNKSTASMVVELIKKLIVA